ncbi:hypothetical protein AKJ16_DCAP00596 [Drosera capensis]
MWVDDLDCVKYGRRSRERERVGTRNQKKRIDGAPTISNHPKKDYADGEFADVDHFPSASSSSSSQGDDGEMKLYLYRKVSAASHRSLQQKKTNSTNSLLVKKGRELGIVE